ncbi:hypothetical protein [Streptosporangium sp. NPDC049304]
MLPQLQLAIAPARIRIQVGEQPLGTARSHLLGPMDDIRIEYGPHP